MVHPGETSPRLRHPISHATVTPVLVERGTPLVCDGVALTVLGDTVVLLWKNAARLHRSKWVYDITDSLVPEMTGGLLALMVILPTADPPDRACRVENAKRLRRLRPDVRRMVTVVLGDDRLWGAILRSVVRVMTLAAGWSGTHFVEATLRQGVGRLLQAAGPSSPTGADLERMLLDQFHALDLAPNAWLHDETLSDTREAPVAKLTDASTVLRPGPAVFAAPGPAPTRILAGSLEVASRLRLREPLGRGGMGELWVGEHLGLQCEVVVKFLRDRPVDDPKAPERVAREAAATARVRSPHVVQVLDHGVSAAGLPFLVMERLEGCDLRAYLDLHGHLACREVATVVEQLAAALTKTHSVGLVHADVKPSNVFLCAGQDLFLKLLDFGLAQRMDSTGAAHRCPPPRAGTPPYMSPEQIAGRPLDERSDVWSLGVLAFECLIGARPFDGESTGAMRLAIEALPLPKPSAARADLPEAFDTWFATACARSPQDRFRTAEDAAKALSSALDVQLKAERFRFPSGFHRKQDGTLGSGRTRTG